MASAVLALDAIPTRDVLPTGRGVFPQLFSSLPISTLFSVTRIPPCGHTFTLNCYLGKTHNHRPRGGRRPLRADTASLRKFTACVFPKPLFDISKPHHTCLLIGIHVLHPAFTVLVSLSERRKTFTADLFTFGRDGGPLASARC